MSTVEETTYLHLLPKPGNSYSNFLPINTSKVYVNMEILGSWGL